jgi:hypothetical protein
MSTQDVTMLDNSDASVGFWCHDQAEQKGCGRPLFDGKDESEVVAKLQYAFSIGAQTKEACNLADISTDSFYRYCKKYPEFRNTIDRLQTNLILLARKTVADSILAGDVKTAFWYLERKCPQEFSIRGSEQHTLQRQAGRIAYLEEQLFQNQVKFS